jgi:superfamily II DNA/RNA helicase
VGRARTGCGKTLAFVLPIVEKLKESLGANGRRVYGRTPSVVVLLPTRELAKQVMLCEAAATSQVEDIVHLVICTFSWTCAGFT